MTVKELKNKLDQYPDNVDVMIGPHRSEFEYGLLDEVKQEPVEFKDGKLKATQDCVVLYDI